MATCKRPSAVQSPTQFEESCTGPLVPQALMIGLRDWFAQLQDAGMTWQDIEPRLLNLAEAAWNDLTYQRERAESAARAKATTEAERLAVNVRRELRERKT